MKQQIKNYLFKKRFKILKSKKGFSLIEVLVAVAIIGIISAIAVPQFTANRDQAAQVASDTSISNILKAFNNCIVLNDFSKCNTLSALKVTCPDCDSKHAGGNKFCAHIKKGSGTPPDFAACVSIDTGQTPQEINRSYGGTLLQKTICHRTSTPSGDGSTCTSTAKTAASPVKVCSQTTLTADCGSNQGNSNTACGYNVSCEQGGNGTCDNNANCT